MEEGTLSSSPGGGGNRPVQVRLGLGSRIRPGTAGAEQARSAVGKTNRGNRHSGTGWGLAWPQQAAWAPPYRPAHFSLLPSMSCLRVSCTANHAGRELSVGENRSAGGGRQRASWVAPVAPAAPAQHVLPPALGRETCTFQPSSGPPSLQASSVCTLGRNGGRCTPDGSPPRPRCLSLLLLVL